jgi:outer membrane lipoprotein-sorting protein
MSLLTNRPALRWALPVGVLAVALAGAGSGQLLRANAAPSLPERTAAQLLVDLQKANPDGFSGTVVQKADLGLPELPRVGGSGSSDLSSLVSGAHTLRVWYAGEQKVRIALLGTLGESDVIRNGNDVWVWNSQRNEASRHTLPSRSELTNAKKAPSLAEDLPKTPQEAAERALAAIDPTTKVFTDGTATVAGRSAYELVLSPRDTASRVGQVRLAVDAKERIPLRVRIFAKDATTPAFEVGFTRLSFVKPGDEQFRFTPPPGATITKGNQLDGQLGKAVPERRDRTKSAPTLIGKGWTSVLVLRGDPMAGSKPPAAAPKADLPPEAGPDAVPAEPLPDGPMSSMFGALPQVNGSWGSGHLLQSKLFSVLFIDDGRVLVGAVSPERLYTAASDPAAALNAPSTPKAPR